MGEHEDLLARIATLERELAKSQRVASALKDRVKRGMQTSGSAFALFESTIVLQEAVAQKTRDLEEARRAAEAASIAKNDFLATMSHEIRTPLNGIVGMAHFIAEALDDEEQQAHLSEIFKAADTLATVIDDILDYSRVEAGRIELEVAEFDLPTLIEQVASMTQRRFVSPSTCLTCNVDPVVAPWRRGDAHRLRQVLLALLSNAMKFTVEGEVAIDVFPHPETDGDSSLRFRVRDTGIGIAPAFQKRLFEPFWQADASATRAYGGTGMGLAIASELVALMGGQLTVESALGEGSTFAFTLDLPVCASPVRPDAAPQRAKLPALDLDVLIVEDNPSTAPSPRRWSRVGSAGSRVRKTARKPSRRSSGRPSTWF